MIQWLADTNRHDHLGYRLAAERGAARSLKSNDA
jgi:hypothetical protein